MNDSLFEKIKNKKTISHNRSRSIKIPDWTELNQTIELIVWIIYQTEHVPTSNLNLINDLKLLLLIIK